MRGCMAFFPHLTRAVQARVFIQATPVFIFHTRRARFHFHPRPPPGPLLAQGVNPAEVSAGPGAGKHTVLSSLIRAAW